MKLKSNMSSSWVREILIFENTKKTNLTPSLVWPFLSERGAEKYCSIVLHYLAGACFGVRQIFQVQFLGFPVRWACFSKHAQLKPAPLRCGDFQAMTLGNCPDPLYCFRCGSTVGKKATRKSIFMCEKFVGDSCLTFTSLV